MEHNGNDGCNAEEHYNTLNEVIDGCGFITTQNNIYCRQRCHYHGTVFVGNIETHLKEFRDTHIDTSCIRDKEYEGYDRGYHTKPLIIIACTEEIRHGTTLNVLGHQFGTLSQYEPGKQRTDDSITNTYP